MKRLRVAAGIIGILLFTSAVFAHDGEFGSEENPLDVNWIGDLYSLDLDHEDGTDETGDFKGWAKIWLKNICGDDWGDFHFEIKSILGITNIENISFLDDTGHEPQLWLRTAPFTWVQYTDLEWTIDNDVVGATIDLEFYDSPVIHDQWAMFKVYTDNTSDRCAWFRISGHPTPVPEPVTIVLLGLGALALRRRGKR